MILWHVFGGHTCVELIRAAADFWRKIPCTRHQNDAVRVPNRCLQSVVVPWEVTHEETAETVTQNALAASSGAVGMVSSKITTHSNNWRGQFDRVWERGIRPAPPYVLLTLRVRRCSKHKRPNIVRLPKAERVCSWCNWYLWNACNTEVRACDQLRESRQTKHARTHGVHALQPERSPCIHDHSVVFVISIVALPIEVLFRATRTFGEKKSKSQKRSQSNSQRGHS